MIDELPAILLDRLAHRVADMIDDPQSSTQHVLAALVSRLEALAGRGLGGAERDSPVVLARRFARAHRDLLAGASHVRAEDLRCWLEVLQERPAAQTTSAPDPAFRGRRRRRRACELSWS
jgi:hypothetical protein